MVFIKSMRVFLSSNNLKLHNLQPKKEKPSDETSIVDTSIKKTSSRASLSKASSDIDLSTDNDEINHVHSSSTTEDNEQHKVKNDVPVSLYNEDTSNVEVVSSIVNGDIANGSSSKSNEEISSASVTLEENESVKNHPSDDGQDVLLKDQGNEIVINKEGSQSLKDHNLKIEPQIDEKKNQEYKKVQDQLDSPKKIQDEPTSPKKGQDQSGSSKKIQDQLEEVNYS